MQRCQVMGIQDVEVDDIFLGNGVSELIVMAMQALLNNEDEILIPAPDYPLWTASVNLAGGKAIHYLCDEKNDWQPDIDDITKKITTKTRGIVVINPNNPTGAVYSKNTLNKIIALARKYSLIIYADEIYDRILFDGAKHIPIASLASDVLFVTLNGLSKTYRLAGFRSGWLVVSGAKQIAKSYLEGLETLSSVRLCANVPAMYAIQTALGGRQSIEDLTGPGGRLLLQRDTAWSLLTNIPGVSCIKPKAAMYLFPRLDPKIYPIKNDESFVLDLLLDQKILVVQGTAFNWPDPDHFRIVFLPREDDITEAIQRLSDFLKKYRIDNGTET
jgi:alanine-synthesizing transaminase